MTTMRWMGSASVWFVAACCLLGGASALAAQDPVVGKPPMAVPTPWERSLTLEAANDLVGAKAVLVDAYGAAPVYYDVSVRLAWLTLRMEKGLEAVALYRRAMKIPGALAEAKQGLVLALNMAGYQALDRGNYPTARRSWDEVLRYDRDNIAAHAGKDLVGDSTGVLADIWYARFSSDVESSQAASLYLGLPVRIDNNTSVRGVYRSIGGASGTTDSTRLFDSQHEWFVGATVESGRFATEVIAMALSNTLKTSVGGAISTRFGGRVGGSLTLSGIKFARGTNVQVVPRAFAWVKPWLAVGGGVRFTSDSQYRGTSMLAGATVRRGRLELDAEGHSGSSRSAFNTAGPTVLSFLSDTRSGGTLTFSALVRSDATLFLQLQMESLGDPNRGSHYTGLAAGVRLAAGPNIQ